MVKSEIFPFLKQSLASFSYKHLAILPRRRRRSSYIHTLCLPKPGCIAVYIVSCGPLNLDNFWSCTLPLCVCGGCNGIMLTWRLCDHLLPNEKRCRVDLSVCDVNVMLQWIVYYQNVILYRTWCVCIIKQINVPSIYLSIFEFHLFIGNFEFHMLVLSLYIKFNKIFISCSRSQFVIPLTLFTFISIFTVSPLDGCVIHLGIVFSAPFKPPRRPALFLPPPPLSLSHLPLLW